MSLTQILLLLIPLAYLAGSIPFGLIVGRLRGIDPRKAGSGNIGSTNVGRLLGTKYFWIVFFLDLLKGLLPTAAASVAVHAYAPNEAGRTIVTYLLWLAVALAALLGHMFSVFLRFQGGKGAATGAGVAIGVFPYFALPALIGLTVFVLLFVRFRYISLGSICGAAAVPISYIIAGLIRGWPIFGNQSPLLVFSLLMSFMIIYRHRGNIARLRAGTESRFAARSTAPVEHAPTAANNHT